MDAWMDQKQWTDEYTINYSLNNPCNHGISLANLVQAMH